MPTSTLPKLTRYDLLRAIHTGRVWHYPAGNGAASPTDRIETDTGHTVLIRPGIRMAALHITGLANHPPIGTNNGRVPWRLTTAGQEEMDRLAPRRPTPDECEALFHAALRAGDPEGAYCALLVMAPQDPHRAERIRDTTLLALAVARDLPRKDHR